MSEIAGPAPKPCSSCPYRRDVPSGVWSAQEYRKLPAYDADTPFQPAGLFQCHQNGAGDDVRRVCAGWVGCHGVELLALRLAVSSRRLAASVMDYVSPVPLFASGREASEHGMREIRRPSREARALIAKIRGRRPEVARAPEDSVPLEVVLEKTVPPTRTRLRDIGR